MRPSAVRRLSLFLMAGFVLASGGFALVVGHHLAKPDPVPASSRPGTAPQIAVPDGAALYQRRCARCHDLPEMAQALRRHPEDPRGWAIDFLAGHRHSAPTENGAIVDHLITVTADIEAAPDPVPEDAAEDDFSL